MKIYADPKAWKELEEKLEVVIKKEITENALKICEIIDATLEELAEKFPHYPLNSDDIFKLKQNICFKILMKAKE